MLSLGRSLRAVETPADRPETTLRVPCSPATPGPHEPRLGGRVGREEAQELLGHLPLAGRRRMGAVAGEVALLVGQTVGALHCAVCPQVWPPAQPRRLHRPL